MIVELMPGVGRHEGGERPAERPATSVRPAAWPQLEQPRLLCPSPSARLPRPGTTRDFARLLARFAPISLGEMSAVSLLNRSDTKYLLSVQQLRAALAALPEHYRALEVGGARLARYRTLYFDTPDFALYRQHHADRRLRCKVRSRLYVDSKQSFLEVKWKGKRGRTVKTRLQTGDFVTEWLAASGEQLGCALPAGADTLEPKLMNAFYRATLVSARRAERVTIDLGLQFSAAGRTIAVPGVAIAEVKQDGVDRCSEFACQLRAAGVRPGGFSKYCVGVALLCDEVKHNQFKPKLRLLNELLRGHYDD